MLVAKEAYVHLVVLPLKDFGRPIAKSFHLGPHQVVAGALPGEHTHKKKPDRTKTRPRGVFLPDSDMRIHLSFNPQSFRSNNDSHKLTIIIQRLKTQFGPQKLYFGL